MSLTRYSYLIPAEFAWTTACSITSPPKECPMKMIGRSDTVSFCSHHNEYGLAETFKERTDLVSYVVDIVQQPPCEAFQSVLAQLRSEPRRLIIETKDSSTNTGLIITKCLRQQIREPSHIFLESRGCVFVPHPSVVGVRAKTVYGDDARLHASALSPGMKGH